MKKIAKKAFTLIELSIVLVIIGIILASVMKGRDLISSANSKEITQTFIQKWATIANTYFSNTRQIMADGTENGGDTAVNTGLADGYFDNISYDYTQATYTDNPAYLLIQKLQDAGIDPCELVKTDMKDADTGICSSGFNPFKRNLKGEFVGKRACNVHFYKMTLDSKVQNVIIFTNVPGDLAKAIDTIVDGIPDGTSGSIVGFDKQISTDFEGASPTITGTYPDDTTGTHSITTTVDWVASALNGSSVREYYYYSLGYIMEN